MIALKAVYPVAGMALFASHQVDAEKTCSGSTKGTCRRSIGARISVAMYKGEGG